MDHFGSDELKGIIWFDYEREPEVRLEQGRPNNIIGSREKQCTGVHTYTTTHE